MMILLVSAPNMLQLFCGWEGVGLASYLLGTVNKLGF
jgi:NADH:ubiquinone oxidoreductase subunit 5 (subunit L)/multisubunit Na+/H+ antiporter MnhA subunit